MVPEGIEGPSCLIKGRFQILSSQCLVIKIRELDTVGSSKLKTTT